MNPKNRSRSNVSAMSFDIVYSQPSHMRLSLLCDSWNDPGLVLRIRNCWSGELLDMVGGLIHCDGLIQIYFAVVGAWGEILLCCSLMLVLNVVVLINGGHLYQLPDVGRCRTCKKIFRRRYFGCYVDLTHKAFFQSGHFGFWAGNDQCSVTQTFLIYFCTCECLIVPHFGFYWVNIFELQ